VTHGGEHESGTKYVVVCADVPPPIARADLNQEPYLMATRRSAASE